MEQLEDLVLEEAAGGAAPKGHVKVVVSISWSGNAAANLHKVSSLDLTLKDPEGPAHATLSAANNWKASFYVKKGVDFTCWIDFRKYPFIKNWDYNWNQRTNQFVYFVS